MAGGRDTGGRVKVGRRTGIRVLPAGRVVVGRLTAEGRLVAERVGATPRVGRGCDTPRRTAVGWRLLAERVVTVGRLILLRDVGRRLLVLSARVKPALQVMATARLRVSKCLLVRIMVLLLLGISENRLLAIAPLQLCKRQRGRETDIKEP